MIFVCSTGRMVFLSWENKEQTLFKLHIPIRSMEESHTICFLSFVDALSSSKTMLNFWNCENTFNSYD